MKKKIDINKFDLDELEIIDAYFQNTVLTHRPAPDWVMKASCLYRERKNEKDTSNLVYEQIKGEIPKDKII